MKKIATNLILILLGTGFSIWGWGLIADARLSMHWPTSSGTVILSEVSSYDSRSDGKTTRMYTANVRYRYAVNGVQYHSGRVSLGDSSTSSAADKRAIAERYPVGSQVTVYYDPDQPQDALLEVGPVLITYIPLVFGLLATIAGILAFFWRSNPMPPPGQRHSGLTGS